MSNPTYTPETDPQPRKKRLDVVLLLAIVAMVALGTFLVLKLVDPKVSKEIPASHVGDQAVADLLYTQLPSALEEIGVGPWVVDEVNFNEERTQAMIWMAEEDPESGETIGTEPHVALALWDNTKRKWQLHLTTDPDFGELFQQSYFAEGELAERFLALDSKAVSTGATYGGYLLPWREGLSKRLTWSVGHNSCASGYCKYAFDFADGTMFEILAAKGGYVFHWRDTCPNNATWCTNSITLEDRTTTPWTYQIYLHIAKNSVPEALKKRGAYVWQGMKIANVDDTGYSSGHHLHFMVVEKGTLLKNPCNNYCWGKSVDITFKDVTLNWDSATDGGRPRLAGEASWYGGTGTLRYISENTFLPGPWTETMPQIVK